MATTSEFAQIIGSLAEQFFGEPNRSMSSERELRYGARGSMSIDLDLGTWFDHEANEGGGVLDLVGREMHLSGADRLDWLKREGYLFDTVKPNGNGHGDQQQPRAKIVAHYNYEDEQGELLSQVVRFEPKDFRQRRPDGANGWVWSVKGVRQVPYRLPQLVENGDKVVCIVEGEKDADKLWSKGVPATCNLGGAGKWRPELNDFFRDADVVIIPDRDPQKVHPKTGEPMFHPDGRPMLPGQDHAQAVAAALHGIAARVRVLELWKEWQAMPLKGDVSDWLDQGGGSAEELYAAIARCPEWSTTTTAEENAPAPVPLIYPFPIDGEKIPRRAWVVPGLLLRRNVSILVAPPGSGKSLLTLQQALMMAEGQPWGGWWPRGNFKSLVINAEDDSDEMQRRLYAARETMKVDQATLKERVAIAENPSDIIVAKADARTKTVVRTPMVERLVSTVINGNFDVLVVDPFAETFEGDENSNSELKWAAVLWRDIARRTNAAVMLVHHTRKFGAEAGSMDSARGGGSLVGVARTVSTLFAMTEEEADAYEVEPHERHLYLRFDDAKANLALVTHAARWFIKKTYTLPNAGPDGEPADDVGVLEPWKPQGVFARMTIQVANRILDALARGTLDKNGEPDGGLYALKKKGGAKRYAGSLIQEHLECSDDEARDVLTAWEKSGLIEEVEFSDKHRNTRTGIRVHNEKRPGSTT